MAGHDVVRARRRVRGVISLTGPNVALDEWQTGEENLAMMGRLLHLSRPEARRRAAQLLEQFDLMEARKRAVKTYSGGMRRRLDLALGLIGRPRVIFLDEPTTGLDPASRQAMWAAIRALVSAGATVLLTTQYLEEADHLADRIAVIDGGRVVAEGTADELKSTLGGERADLIFAADDDFRAASRTLGGGATRTDQRRLLISVATDGSAAQVRRLLDRLAEQRIAVDKIALHKPSLDDVFLTLTGEPAATAATEAATAAMDMEVAR